MMAEQDQSVSNGASEGWSLEVEYLGVDKPRLDAIQQSAKHLLASMFSETQGNCDCVWPLIDAVWPARSTDPFRHLPKDRIRLTLEPLSRIGQMEGKSGSVVLIGCFRDTQDGNIPESHPVVVKTAPISSGKLKGEYDNALTIRPFAYQHKDVFSIPFRKDEKGGFDVLWSLLSSSSPLWQAQPQATPPQRQWTVNDLRTPIQRNDVETVSQVLQRAYSTMHNLHMPFGRRTLRSLNAIGEYDWYLRDYGKKWGEEWEPVFGPKLSPITRFAESDWANPLWIVEQLKEVTCDFTLGAIHGDLHPGNVVIGLPHDSWAREMGYRASAN